MGGKNAVDLVAHDGSNAVAAMADVDDPDAMMAGLGSPPPEIAAVMEKHGVRPPLVAYVEKEPVSGQGCCADQRVLASSKRRRVRARSRGRSSQVSASHSERSTVKKSPP